MAEEFSQSVLDRTDIFSEFIQIKTILKIITDMIHCLDLKIIKRLKSITDLLVSKSIDGDLKELTTAITQEYNLFKEEIQETTQTLKECITDAQEKFKLKAVISEDAAGQADSTQDVAEAESFLDRKKLTQNLNTLIAIVEDLQKENHRLQVQNQTLTEEMMEITENSFFKKQDVQKIYSDLPATPHASENSYEIPYLKSLKELIVPFSQTRESIRRSRFSVMEPERSFSHEYLAMDDKSFIIDESETKLLTEHKWKIALEKLKSDQEAMTLIEMKLATVKTKARSARRAARRAFPD